MTSAETPLVAGIDIGGTKCAAAIAEATSEKVLAQSRWPSEVDKGPQAMIRRMSDEVRKLLTRTPGKLVGVGVACGGPLDRHSGLVLSPPNLPGWDRVSLTARLAASLGAPAWLENDANAGALGEFRYGAGRGCQNMVYVTISTGIGAGLMINGQLLYGLGESAGEVGHQTVLAGGPKCGCGNSGCLEMLASGSAIGRRARAAALAEPSSARRLIESANNDLNQVTARHVADGARSGDPFARRIWSEAIGYLAIGLSNVVTILAPQRVILGGGMAGAGDMLFEPLQAGIRQRVRLVPVEQVEVLPAGLGPDSALRGSLAVAIQAIADKRPMAPRTRAGRRTTGDLRRVVT